MDGENDFVLAGSLTYATNNFVLFKASVSWRRLYCQNAANTGFHSG